MSGIELKGLDEVVSQLAAIGEKIPSTIGDTLIEKTIEIARESYRQTPVDLGNLRGTQEIDGPIIEENIISTIISYSAVYALRQHEDMSYHHKVGKARYLSDPIEDKMPELGFMVGDAFEHIYDEVGIR